MKLNEQLKTLEGANTFIKDLSEECRRNLLVVLNDVENPKRYKIVVNEKFIGGYVEALGCNAKRISTHPLDIYDVNRDSTISKDDIEKIHF